MIKPVDPSIPTEGTPVEVALSVAPRIGGRPARVDGVPDALAEWSTERGWSAIQAQFSQAGWSPEQVHEWLTTPLPEADGRPPEVLFREDPADLWTLICQATLHTR